MNDIPHMIYGMPIYESDQLVIDGEPYKVRRSWRERLLTRPWRPWHAIKWVTPKIPNPNFFVSNGEPFGRCIYAHPETARKLYEKIDRGEI